MGDRSKALVTRSKQPFAKISTGGVSFEYFLPAINILRHCEVHFVCARRLICLKVEENQLIARSLRAHTAQTTQVFSCYNKFLTGRAFCCSAAVKFFLTISFPNNFAALSALIDLRKKIKHYMHKKHIMMPIFIYNHNRIL